MIRSSFQPRAIFAAFAATVVLILLGASPGLAQVTNDTCGDGLGTVWFGIMNDDVNGPARAATDLERVECSQNWRITFTSPDNSINTLDVVLERNQNAIALVLIGACVMRGELGPYTETIAGTHSCGGGQSFVLYAGRRLAK